MINTFATSLATVALFLFSTILLSEENLHFTSNDSLPIAEVSPFAAPAPFTAYTGKISRDRVRLRLEPHLEAPIVKELAKEELLVVVGEEEDYYAVQVPSSIKGYLFRTFVLDGVVEGENVNVRLEPDTESLIIGHVNTGDVVSEEIHSANNKWLEIDPPESSRMYVYKDYVEKVGNVHFLAKQEKRGKEVVELIKMGRELAEEELAKSFSELDLKEAFTALNHVVKDYADFPSQTKEARELLSHYQEEFLKQKIAYLEARTSGDIPADSLPPVQVELASVETSIRPTKTATHSHKYPESRTFVSWEVKEQNLFNEWLENHEQCSLAEFYEEQKTAATQLTGILETYNRSVNNKPGDYVLLDPTNRLPMAYLYSTQIDLNDYLGKEVSFEAASRPNNHFAFPAYYVLSAR